MASICAVGNPLLSPQDASSIPFLSLSPTLFILSCVLSTDQSIKRSLSFFFCFACSASALTFTTTELLH